MGKTFRSLWKNLSIAGLRLFLASATLATLAVSDLPAQGLSHWEFNIHAATLRENLFEETGNGLQAGVRLLRNTRSGLGFGGSFDVVRRSDVDLGAGIAAENPSLTMFLYSAGLDYVFPTRGRARFFLSAGFGAATTQLEGVSDPRVQESSTGQLIPMGAGFKIYNRPVDPSWAFRMDVRDNLIFVNTLTPGADDEELEPRHNLEFSAGLSFAFGGGPRQRTTPLRPTPPAGVADTDRDGVPNALDGCEDTPPGSAVDDIGCPTALDTDGDGVPDRALPPRPTVDSDGDGVPDGPDRCPDTPRGVRVDALGCRVPEEAAPAPARPAPARPAPPARPVDSDGDGVADAVDRCPDTPRGVRIDSLGCPIPEAAPAPPAVVDSDGDGVADPDDRCVNTPRGVAVNASGCPIDTDPDRDGVSGAADRCPNTPPGVAVDASGCLAAAAPPDDERLEPPAARQPPEVEPQEEPEEEPAAVPPALAGACVDSRPWFDANIPVLFEGREWRKVGTPEPITPDNLRRVGEVDGVPVLVSAFARQPYSDIWLPLCIPAGSYQLYVP